MSGKPEGLGVYPGTSLSEIVLRQNDLSLVFILPSVNPPKVHGTISIGVRGEWELRGKDGTVLDCAKDHRSGKETQIRRLIGRTVVKANLTPPMYYQFIFDDGIEFHMLPDE